MVIEYITGDILITNEDLKNKFPNWDIDSLTEKVGIYCRYRVKENETSLDLAIRASKKLFENYNIDESTIDYILFCTQSPDYFLPSNACLLQHALKLDKNIGAIDINQGCSGYIYGLSIAKGLLATGEAENILFITSETYSKYIHEMDKINQYIFSDAASATLITKNDLPKFYKSSFGTDGSGANNLIVKNGAARYPFDPNPPLLEYGNKNYYTHNNLYMNGPEIFNFTIRVIPDLIIQVLEKNKMKLEDIDYFIFHQANKYMLEHLRKKLKISPEKFYNNLSYIGNTVSSSIPIAIKELQKDGRIKSGDKLLLVGFGVGYSWGAIVIEI